MVSHFPQSKRFVGFDGDSDRHVAIPDCCHAQVDEEYGGDEARHADQEPSQRAGHGDLSNVCASARLHDALGQQQPRRILQVLNERVAEDRADGAVHHAVIK